MSPSRCRRRICPKSARRSPPRPPPSRPSCPATDKRADGQVTMIENTVDPTTGMATHPRHHAEQGRSALAGHSGHHRPDAARTRRRWSCRTAAVQVSQTGNFVFVVDERRRQGAAGQGRARRSTARRWSPPACTGGETVVTDGQLLLSNGTRVNARAAAAGAKAGRKLIHEYLGNLHSPPGVDDADDGVADRVRRLRLPAAAGGGAAGGRLPDHPDHRAHCRAPAPRPWRPRSPRRSSGSSRPSPASRR